MDDGWDSVEVVLQRFGIPAKQVDRPAIIAALNEQIDLEVNEAGDQDLMRLLCAQLFSLGVVEDSLLIWRAKSCNFDTHCAIDVRFVCGAGLPQTKMFLESVGSTLALDALAYFQRCEAEFNDFSVEHVLNQAKAFYSVT